MLFPSRKITDYATGDGPVRYMDGSTLVSKADLPRRLYPVAGVFLLLAIAIGAALLYNVVGGALQSAARAQASVAENLARDVALDLPSLTAYASMDDASIEAQLTEGGHTVYNLTSEDEGATFDLVKLPGDVSAAEAALMYGKGISNLSASEAALILNGSWRLQVDRDDGLNMSVKYADFDSGSMDAAIDAAIASQGLDPAAFSEIATDDAGNTYREAEVAAGDATTCRVSAIALSSVYDIDGLPDTAVYVGIRLN